MMIADRFSAFGTTIFTEMTLLANRHGAVNLAQGFPDFDGPAYVRAAAAEALGIHRGEPKPEGGSNQYARMFGLPVLNQAIASWWESLTGMRVEPDTSITVTSGCTEAIASAMLGLVNPGDEVILFEPYYDSYRASIAMASGVPKFVTLRADPTRGVGGGFGFDEQELRRAFTPRTKLILVNTPHNPTGKVFSSEELSLIASLCQKHGVFAITDEVYECLTYNTDEPHVRLATLPGMEDRTLTLSSLGKSFGLTGWKIGWGIGTPDLSRGLRMAHQFLTFSTSTPLQIGAAAAFTSPERNMYLQGLVTQFRSNRDLLADALERLCFAVSRPAGAYFLMVDWSGPKAANGRCAAFENDVEFCKALPQLAGVAAIPPSAFYEYKEHARHLARFAFCKKRETLEEAIRRLERWANS